ncbi:MAG: FAD-dependent thymidylate synthase [Cyanobacteria bacterium P01_H01_bin.35]
MDKFRVEVIAKTPNPQQVIYAALHQDYSEGFVFDEQNNWPSEAKCGEIIVKRLLAGDRGHYGCYSADTEVLTNQGWMTWNEVTYAMKLLAVNTDTKEAWFEKPSQLYEYDVDDELYYVQSNFIDLLVTKDHRMIISRRTSTENNWTEWFSKKAEDVYNTSVRYLLNCYLKNSARKLPNDLPENIDLQTAFRIAGFFYRDGLRSINKNSDVVRFRIKNSRKIDYLLSLNLEIKETQGNRFVIEHKSLASWIHRNFSNSEDKTVPIWLLELPANLIASFWDGLQNSDRTNIKEKSWCCNSTNKNALEIIQATAHINGFRANLTLNNKNDGEAHKNYKPCWRLHISEISTYPVECCKKNRGVGIKEGFVNYKGKVYCASVSTGALLVRRNGKVIVCGNCIEHPQITFNCGFFPHSVMQQARTHRVGVTFDVQSYRYCSGKVIAVAEGKTDIETAFYLRPIGKYSDRKGKKYYYSAEQREQDLQWCLEAAKKYKIDIELGMSEEHARGKIPFDYRQHFVVSFNCRSLLHFLDLRFKKNAQLEIQKLCELMWPHVQDWVPNIAEWYEKNRLGKSRLAP